MALVVKMWRVAYQPAWFLTPELPCRLGPWAFQSTASLGRARWGNRSSHQPGLGRGGSCPSTEAQAPGHPAPLTLDRAVRLQTQNGLCSHSRQSGLRWALGVVRERRVPFCPCAGLLRAPVHCKGGRVGKALIQPGLLIASTPGCQPGPGDGNSPSWPAALWPKVTCRSRSRRTQTCRKCSRSRTGNRACSEGNRGPGDRRGLGGAGAPMALAPSGRRASWAGGGCAFPGPDGTPDLALPTARHTADT